MEDFDKLVEEFNGKLNDMKLQQNLSNQLESQIQTNDNKNVDNKYFSLLNEYDKATIHEEVINKVKKEQLESYKADLLKNPNTLKKIFS